ncbi:hypothetical protein [Facklamia miroungae]|uniref:Competence protein ComGF n=1 Tax=Facklamia miroungae TaxID=120956 RepID=A0A1G7U2N1_9LACT|nr:hypothetical protein [Facklamia miroungae]NKZ29878.1 hypothetical protein [Facklamia miroungae]SDG41644.1 hypothetical protein SAMN05421791_10825 [Facklamia miroungae]
MILGNKQGTSLIEALVGLIIFSWLLSFYLPGLTQELRTFKQLKTESQEWHLFYQLVDIQLSTLDIEQKEALLSSTIETNQLLYSIEVEAFSCDATSCQIEFKRGSNYHISLQDIQEI